MSARFVRYEHRSPDPDAARDFYAVVLGRDLWSRDVDAVPLPPSAAARGAPSHWLGHLGVGRVDDTAARFVDHGAERLGSATPDVAVVRDPFGAIVALSAATQPMSPRESAVAWHVLHTRDGELALAAYAATFGWRRTRALELPPNEGGRGYAFAWDRTAPEAGMMSSAARLSWIHTQWLFFFRVDALDDAREIVRDRGGEALPAVATPDGDRVAACDDPQGAAFGLFERRRA